LPVGLIVKPSLASQIYAVNKSLNVVDAIKHSCIVSRKKLITRSEF
jgi:hypothetical protein